MAARARARASESIPHSRSSLCPRDNLEDDIELARVPSTQGHCFSPIRPLWHPPGRRGVYGGILIAQCVFAAHETVTKAFVVHSLHCHFLTSVKPNTPVIYQVLAVHDEQMFPKRTIKVFQRSELVFYASASLMEDSLAVDLPSTSKATLDQSGPRGHLFEASKCSDQDELEGTPFLGYRMSLDLGVTCRDPRSYRARKMIKSREPVSCRRYPQAQVEALAHLSDMYFIGTAAEAHSLKRVDLDDENIPAISSGPKVSMMVTLSHTIHFHNPKLIRIDSWMISEMECPWTGDGRALVLQRLWDSNGSLLATSTQEGIIRLQQSEKL